jgi:hypothetical protein
MTQSTTDRVHQWLHTAQVASVGTVPRRLPSEGRHADSVTSYVYTISCIFAKSSANIYGNFLIDIDSQERYGVDTELLPRRRRMVPRLEGVVDGRENPVSWMWRGSGHGGELRGTNRGDVCIAVLRVQNGGDWNRRVRASAPRTVPPSETTQTGRCLMNKMPMAILGASGYIGSHVARRLADHGVRQRLIARDAHRLPSVPHAEAAVVASYGDGWPCETPCRTSRRSS